MRVGSLWTGDGGGHDDDLTRRDGGRMRRRESYWWRAIPVAPTRARRIAAAVPPQLSPERWDCFRAGVAEARRPRGHPPLPGSQLSAPGWSGTAEGAGVV
ncbi:MAG: hypothetical protein AVDCRST_MAG11-2658 [uncultured Gemmatimonadaceae bacterium]|uniref:Uncharacterized protein n=1 Tax=uncultured Gemmatimonadaceae bacterium TaxID=246130 RepID=A0A6J4LKF1_9BACT|nr:MAG: hypothetical protein AVDCRST_MAG11-2658 [uncultured Gemmatimonadaceae bacterium]